MRMIGANLNVKKFLKLILNENPKFVFIEVQCKSFVYNDNIHYYSNEHCSYFDNYSLQILLKYMGYKKFNMKKVFNSPFQSTRGLLL